MELGKMAGIPQAIAAANILKMGIDYRNWDYDTIYSVVNWDDSLGCIRILHCTKEGAVEVLVEGAFDSEGTPIIERGTSASLAQELEAWVAQNSPRR